MLNEVQQKAWDAVETSDLTTLQQVIAQLDDVNFTHDRFNLLALCVSEQNYSIEIANFLLDQGVDPNVSAHFDDGIGSETIYKNAPIIFMAYINQYHDQNGDYHFFHRLINDLRVDLNASFSEANINPHNACKNPILPYGDESFQLKRATLLHYLAAFGDREHVRMLLATQRVDIDARATLWENKHFMLWDNFYAYQSPQGDVIGFKDTVHGPKEVRVRHNVTPVHIACRRGDLVLMKLLNAYGCKFNLKDHLGHTPHDYLQEVSDDKGLSVPEQELSYLDQKLTKKRYKKRLLLGEANFSFAAAMLEKHQQQQGLAQQVVATEFRNEEQVRGTYPNYQDKRRRLEAQQTQPVFQVDARQFTQHPQIGQQRYKVIQFNCPHDGSRNYQDQTIHLLLRDFFRQAALNQSVGDRVQMALPDPDYLKGKAWYHGYVYHLIEVSAQAGYQLKFKRPFNEYRFPGYQHQRTAKDGSAGGAKQLREFVFEKTNMDNQSILDSYNLSSTIIYGVRCLWVNKVPFCVKANNHHSHDSYTDPEPSYLSSFSI